MSNVSEIAQISLSNARACLESKNYGRSFANFLLFLKLKPECACDVYMEYALASKEWFEQLENEQRLDDLFKGYDQACELYPDHEMVLNNIGAQLFRLGYIQEAAAYIRKSLIINPDYLAARSNLENICCHLVERWHFSMLNDSRRNVAYRFAIQKAIKSGYNTVLDIGTGTGILSLVCEKSGAHQVTACDGSRAMVDVARDVLAANGSQGNIILHHKHSSNLQIPEHLPARVKLMVTETFDAGLFGEHIVSTLIHAWKNLISTSPTGSVIPCGATVYMCGIECDTVRRKSRLLYPVLQLLDLTKLDLLCSTGHVAEEPYTTENLAKIRGGYKILTNITELLRVSFCNLCELESLHKGKEWPSELYVRRSGRLDALAVWFDLHLDDTITISTGADTESCWEQAVYPVSSIHKSDPADYNNCHVKKKDTLQTCFYFQNDCLRLTKCEIVEQSPVKVSPQTAGSCDPCAGGAQDGDKTSPSSVGVSVKECSKQSLPFRKRKVQEDSCCDPESPSEHGATAHCCQGDVGNDVDGNGATSMEDKQVPCCDSENNSLHLQTDGSNMQESDNRGMTELSVSNSDESPAMCDDNDDDIMQSGKSCEHAECCNHGDSSNGDHVVEDVADVNDVNIYMGQCTLDTDTAMADSVEKLTCLAEHADIEYVNDIELNRQYCHMLESFRAKHQGAKLSLLYITPQLSFLPIQAVKMGYDAVAVACSEDHHNTLQQVAALNGCKSGEITIIDLANLNDVEIKADLVVSDLVEPCGALRQHALENLVYHRVTSISERGMVLPQQLKGYGLFIASEELENLSHVTGDEKTLGFHIAEYMNVFQMQNHLNIDLGSLVYTKLSEVTELISIDFSSITLESSPDILDIKQDKTIEITAPGKLSALVYWFDLRMDKDTVVSTLDSRCHWQQAGIMMREDISVSQGQMLKIKVMLQNSCLDVKILQPDCANGHI